jgi:polynucleotide 5'-kinase involved in rRNA processing
LPRVTQAELVAKLVAARGTVVVVGGIDTGKTSFGLSVVEAARARGISVGLVDADIDQSTVGPATCVGLKFCSNLNRVDLQTVARADELGFVGSTSAQGHLLPLVAGTARLVRRAREAGCELIVVDTSALVSGIHAEMLKYHKIEVIRPDAVVGFQRGAELDPILGIISRFFPVEVTAIRVDETVTERSAEERLASRERSLASYFAPPLNRWRVKPTVFMPTIPPDGDMSKLDGLVVGLEDGAGRCRGLGVLEYQRQGNLLRMVSSESIGPKGLRLGSVRVSTEGRMLGRVTMEELFGN